MSHAMIWSLAQPHDHGYVSVDVNLVNNNYECESFHTRPYLV